jgi:hypothetical protein
MLLITYFISHLLCETNHRNAQNDFIFSLAAGLANRGTPIVHIGRDNHQHIVLNIIRVREEEVGVISYHPNSNARRKWLDRWSEIKQKFDSCELDRNNGRLTDEQYAEQYAEQL